MIQWTDRHWRYFARCISKDALLYTEMTMDEALIYNKDKGKLDDFIGHSYDEHPLVLQLGGSDPILLGQATKIASSFGGFCQINLNCGCPSNNAKNEGFGARMMMDPEKVRRCLYEMNRLSGGIEVTVKCRLGVIDNRSRRQSFEPEHSPPIDTFIDACRSGGARTITLHARDCMLAGLSPAQNRSVPPLRYDEVYALSERFPDINFHLNGGISDITSARGHLDACPSLKGVMVGRAVYNNPWILSRVDGNFEPYCFLEETSDETFESEEEVKEKEERDGVLTLKSIGSIQGTKGNVLAKYLRYADNLLKARSKCWGVSIARLSKPLHNWLQGQGSLNKSFKQAFDRGVIAAEKYKRGRLKVVSPSSFYSSIFEGKETNSSFVEGTSIENLYETQEKGLMSSVFLTAVNESQIEASTFFEKC